MVKNVKRITKNHKFMNKIRITQDQKLSLKLTSADTLYELSGTFDLAGEVLEIPSGCVLKFDEGTRIANGMLSLNNTVFEGAQHSIAALVNGTQEELDTDAFDLTGSDKVAIMQSIVSTARIIQLHGRFKNVFDNIKIGYKETTLVGNGAIIENTAITTQAITITSDDFIKISDLEFYVSSGYAIYKNANLTTETKLSFIIDKCRFVSTYNGPESNPYPAIIQLLGSREGNITNCFFQGEGFGSSIGIDRTLVVNTNVIGCMFSNLSYGIRAIGASSTSLNPIEDYSVYACGLNVQSAVMLGCKYGIYIEGNDSFFLNNSMIDFCAAPLVLISQDGANITNNYFSTSQTLLNNFDYHATITAKNNTSAGIANRNQRIIISNNTIYGHRTINNYGIDMDVESKDCIIQGNTFNSCIGFSIHLFNVNNWSTEKLVIDNNRFYFSSNVLIGIGDNTYTGSEQILISNNCAYAANLSGCKLVKAGSQTFGTYIYHNNRFRTSVSAPTSGDNEPQFFWGKQKSTTRFRFNLSFPASSTEMNITNPLSDANAVVYIGNNKVAICVKSISASKIYFTKCSTNAAISFTAIIEHMNNI